MYVRIEEIFRTNHTLQKTYNSRVLLHRIEVLIFAELNKTFQIDLFFANGCLHYRKLIGSANRSTPKFLLIQFAELYWPAFRAPSPSQIEFPYSLQHVNRQFFFCLHMYLHRTSFRFHLSISRLWVSESQYKHSLLVQVFRYFL